MKSAVFIPVRLDSSRLPGKAMRSLEGKPVVQWLFERFKGIAVDHIILCTSTDSSDDPVAEHALKCGVDCFRGSKDDLLERYLGAVKYFEIDTIINVDGDDLFVEPEHVLWVRDKLLQDGCDFLVIEGMPFGATPAALTANALRRACELKSETDTATGWGRFFTRENGFDFRTCEIDDAVYREPDIRFSLDYPEDFEIFKIIIKALSQNGSQVRLADAIRYVGANPEIRNMMDRIQLNWRNHFSSTGGVDPAHEM